MLCDYDPKVGGVPELWPGPDDGGALTSVPTLGGLVGVTTRGVEAVGVTIPTGAGVPLDITIAPDD